jgi:hypothetical protein
MTTKLSLIKAISREEGYGPVHNRATRNNNPGNINWSDWSMAHGATHCEPDISPTIKGRFAVFPSADVGFAAMKALLSGPTYINLTVAQALNRWAPSTDGNTHRATPTTFAVGLAALHKHQSRNSYDHRPTAPNYQLEIDCTELANGDLCNYRLSHG